MCPPRGSLRAHFHRSEEGQKVVDLGSKTAELADSSRNRQIEFEEFERLYQELQKLNAAATNEHVSAVARAFQTADW
jgi:hypothetical protein